MNNETAAPDKRRRQWILVGLVAVFLFPIAGSYLLFYFAPPGQGGGASHGTLIEPPRQLPDLTLHEAGAAKPGGHSLYGKWSLVYLVDGECDRACDQSLYRMRQLRLAQGRDGTRVQRVLINFGNTPVRFDERHLREYAGQLIVTPGDRDDLLRQFRMGPDDRPLRANRLYLVDPRGFLMMHYAPNAAPGGIIDDMKRLLKYSSVG